MGLIGGVTGALIRPVFPAIPGRDAVCELFCGRASGAGSRTASSFARSPGRYDAETSTRSCRSRLRWPGAVLADVSPLASFWRLGALNRTPMHISEYEPPRKHT